MEKPEYKPYWTKPGPGRPKLPPDVRRDFVHYLRITKWMEGMLKWIQFEEETRTGKRPTLARVARGCIQLGIMRYVELKQLPTLER